MLGPTLETARLILRPPQHRDFDDLASMMQEEDTMRYLGGVAPRDAAWRTLSTLAGSWALLGYGMFCAIDKESGEWLGRLGPWRPGGTEGNWPGYEVGWGLKRAAQNKGYAHEGAVAAIDWAFDHLGWEDVIHCIGPENKPSIKLAEKLGSSWQRSSRLAPPFDVAVEIYGQSRAQWRSRQR
jgi:RimJ/RimL family protein N-acetyltransferase